MTRNIENGDGMALAAEAMTLNQAYNLDAAVEAYEPYLLEATGPEELLLALHVRYGHALPEIASVLLAVHKLEDLPEIAIVTLEKPDDTFLPGLPRGFKLSTGETVRIPTIKTSHEVVVEEELPDGWNSHRPHAPEDIAWRCQIARDVGQYLTEGAAECMRIDEPQEHLDNAHALIERFSIYAQHLEDASEFFANLQVRRSLREQRLDEMRELLGMETGIAKLEGDGKGGLADEITGWLGDMLTTLTDITPPPRTYLENIPRLGELSLRERDDAYIEVASAAASEDIDQRTLRSRSDLSRAHRDLETDLTLWMHTQPPETTL